MSRQIINDTYALQIPDSFEMISPEELQEMSRNGGDPFQWGVRDKEKHIMILAMWKKYPAILSWMADLKAIAKRNQELAFPRRSAACWSRTGRSSMPLPASAARKTRKGTWLRSAASWKAWNMCNPEIFKASAGNIREGCGKETVIAAAK